MPSAFLQMSAIIPVNTGIFKSPQETSTEPSAWVGVSVIQGVAKGRQRVSESRMRHACDASAPEILETHEPWHLSQENGFRFCNSVTFLRMMRAKDFTG